MSWTGKDFIKVLSSEFAFQTFLFLAQVPLWNGALQRSGWAAGNPGEVRNTWTFIWFHLVLMYDPSVTFRSITFHLSSGLILCFPPCQVFTVPVWLWNQIIWWQNCTFSPYLVFLFCLQYHQWVCVASEGRAQAVPHEGARAVAHS